MPKLKPETQVQRREHILDSARTCFANAGFHRTTMQDICKAASVSPGALYIYFDSKEALIAGLCERDREQFAERFREVAAASDVMAALNALAQHYFANDPPERHLFVIEMMLEAKRNPRIAAIVNPVEQYCNQAFTALFERLVTDGRVAPRVPIATLVDVLNVMGDGMFWRRAVRDGFDANDVLPAITKVMSELINPVGTEPATAAGR